MECDQCMRFCGLFPCRKYYKANNLTEAIRLVTLALTIYDQDEQVMRYADKLSRKSRQQEQQQQQQQQYKKKQLDISAVL